MKEQFEELFDRIITGEILLKPSEWSEKNVILTSDVTSLPGRFSYKVTPYMKEIVDTFYPYHPAKIIALMAGAQLGKALDINTLIPTPCGFKTMGELKKRDKVFDEKGNIVSVTLVTNYQYNRKCYDVTFSDGSNIVADSEHLWEVWDEKKWETRKKIVINTEKISKTFKHRKTRNRYAIDVACPIKTTAKKFNIEPYILGLWLGDGSKSQNRITVGYKDLENISKIFDELKEPYIVDVNQKGNCVQIVLKREDGKFNKQSNYIRFGERMEQLGVYNKKRIPIKYLRSSKKQRLELLQGLMDSDGYVNNGYCEFVSVEKDLAYDVYELISSLGLKSKIRIKEGGKKVFVFNKEIITKTVYSIYFHAVKELPVFKIKRKCNILPSKKNVRYSEISRRRIINVIEIESRPVKCIQVDSKSHLYLVGKNMIPTHNTQGLITNAICYAISNAPGNMLSLSRDDTLSAEFIESRLDPVIRSSGIQHLIRPSVIRKRNARTGDTSKSKEYAGGRLFAGGLQSIKKLIRQRSIKYGFFDDWDAAARTDKEEGDTFSLLQNRFKTFKNEMKQYYISTPTTKPSNIDEIYLKGDQRRWYVPCPKCGRYIELQWSDDGKKEYGIIWEVDENKKLIENSILYKCQECGETFNESCKYDINLKGKWVPTAEPSQPGFYSYHISSIYAAPHAYGWKEMVYEWLAIFNQGNENQAKKKAFYNQALGLPWEEKQQQIKENALSFNTRDYDIGSIPIELSNLDGNGNIVLITCACDLNGTIDDARLDYDVWGHAANGSIYSIDQGSIGTFQPGRKTEHRAKWTYRHGKADNVWDYFENVIKKKYTYMNKEGFQPVLQVGIDVGYYETYAWEFINKHPALCVGIKGSPNDKFTKAGGNVRICKKSVNIPNLYLLESNLLKDVLAGMINLEWKDNKISQPEGFMNFPNPGQNKYSPKGYFAQYESEHKILKEDEFGEPTDWRWEKKSHHVQNHFFDTACYNMACRYIWLEKYLKNMKIKDGTWADYAQVVNEILND